MSWSAHFMGTPDKIVEALTKQSQNLTSNSKIEFDAALPHMIGLIQQNKGKDKPPLLEFSGNGSAWDGQSSCTISIKNLGSNVLI